MKKKSNYFILIILLILLIIIFLFIYFVKIFNVKNENINNGAVITQNYKYYRCNNKMLGPILKDIFDTNNIIQSNNDWNIYIPCGYNNIEEELKKISINNKNKNKYIFGVNGCDTIVSKNKIWESLVNCYGRKDASKLMPESYVLEDPNEMEIFRKNFNPSLDNIYILKKNIQRKEGLKLTKDYFEIIDGYKDNYKVAQKYIRDLYLINGRKINLRVYLLIIIKDNKTYFYLCKIGKCIYTKKKYNDNDLDFESNITSYNLDMTVYNESPRHFNELIEYINKNNNKKSDGEKLFDNIELLLKKISLCLSKNLYQSKNINSSITFQLFGIDVIFDKNLHPYLLEMNKGPDMTPRDDIDKLMKNTVQQDMLKIVGILNNDNNNSFYLIYG
jgi:hypothetical protein